MHLPSLIKMANQIGDFFASMPDVPEAQEGLALHIKKFWEPRMRRDLLTHLDHTGGTELQPIVVQALTRHRDMLA